MNNDRPCTYAICLDTDDQIVYIGYSITGFLSRAQEHFEALNSSINHEFKYVRMRQYLADGHLLYIRPIFFFDDLTMSYNETLTEHEIQCMELALISAYAPELNYQGTLSNYKFDNSKNRTFTCKRWSYGDYKPLLHSADQIKYPLFLMEAIEFNEV